MLSVTDKRNKYGALVEFYWSGEIEELEKKYFPSAIVPTKHPPQTGLLSNRGFRVERPVMIEDKNVDSFTAATCNVSM